MKSIAFLLSTLFLAQIPLATVANPAHLSTIAQADSEAEIQQIAKNITVRITAENNGGSGVLIAQKGNTYLVLTNAHVVRRATQIKIQAPDGQKYTATAIDGGFDAKYDLALLQFTSRTKYTLANLSDTSPPLVPEWPIYSAGFPFDSTEMRITKGQVSQLSDIPFDDGTQIGYTMNQGEKGIRQGMSGGAIIDPRGVLLGINTVGAAPILPNYTYVDGSKPLPKLAAQYRNANWGVPVYNFLIQVKPDILYGYKFNGLDVSTIQHQVTPTGYMARLNDKARKMTVRIEAGGANGSGVIVAKEGDSYYVLTAKHVVEDEKTRQLFTDTKIITYDQDNYIPTSTVVAEGLDLAVVKFTSKSEYAVAEIGQYYPNTNDIVFAGGFPGRNKINSPLWQWQINPGFLFDPEEGKFRTQNNQSFSNGYDLIYSNISHGGMSGGPVFDTAGKIIAIHGQTEATGNIQLGNSQGISIQTFMGIADKLKINPQLLKIASNKPAVLNATDRQVVIKVMENLAPPQSGDDGERWLAYANQLYRTRQYDKSIAAFDTAIAKGKELEGNYGKALSLWKARKLKLAELTIRRAVSAIPQSNRANYYYFWAKQSVILRNLEKNDLALEAIKIAIELEPKDRILTNEKAVLLRLRGQFKVAIKIYDEMIREQPEAYSYSNRADNKLDSGDKQGAMADYDQAIKINPNEIWYYNRRGSLKIILGDKQGAISDFERSIKINPNDSNAYVNRGNVKSSLGNKQEANVDYNRAAKIIKEDIKNNSSDYAYVNLGIVNYNLGGKQEAVTDYDRAIKINPNNSGAYINRANIKYESGLYQDAYIDYNQAITLDPNLSNAYVGRGNCKSRLGNKKEAIADYDRAIKINSNDIGAYISKGNIKYESGLYSEAYIEFDRAITLDPNSDNAYIGRGNVRFKLGNKTAAIADYNQAVELNSGNGIAYFNRGKTKLDLGQNQAAISDYDRAISIDPKNSKFYVNRCEAQSKLGQKQMALADCNLAIKLNPNDANGYASRGLVKYRAGDSHGAIIDYNQAISIDPKNGKLYATRCEAQSRLGQKQMALADCNLAIKLNPNDANGYASRGSVKYRAGDSHGAIIDYDQAINLNNDAITYYNRGIAKSDLGQKQAAIADYDRAISLDPNYAKAYNNRGWVKADLGQKQAAIADYNWAISIDPNFADAYNSRGQVRLALGQKQAAIADYDRAISIDPNFAQAYNNRGWIKADLGQKQAAIADYDRSISLDSNEAQFYVRRGIARYDLGNKKGAIADFSQTIKINPNFPVAYYIRGIAKADLGDKQGAIDDYSKAAELFRQQGNIEDYQQTMAKIAKLKGN